MNFQDIDPLLHRLPNGFAAQMMQWFIQLRTATAEGHEDEAVELAYNPPAPPRGMNADQLAAHATLLEIFIQEIVALQANSMHSSDATAGCKCARCGMGIV